MVKTVLYAEKLYDNDKVEREVFGPDVRVVWLTSATCRSSRSATAPRSTA